MKELVLTHDVLLKGWGGIGQYWFSLSDYTIKDISQLAELGKPEELSQSEYMLKLGFIPYFIVNNEEVIRAYVEVLDNVKLKNAMKKMNDENYVESFWKYFNEYPELEENWRYFEDNYILSKAIEWCEKNGIVYSMPK